MRVPRFYHSTVSLFRCSRHLSFGYYLLHDPVEVGSTGSSTSEEGITKFGTVVISNDIVVEAFDFHSECVQFRIFQILSLQ